MGAEPFESAAAYTEFVERHRSLGFTDLMTALPSRERWPTVREIATGVIPRLRAADASPIDSTAATQVAASVPSPTSS